MTSTWTTLRPLLPTVFLPSAVFGIGQGAGSPVIALTARDLGASVGVAGVIVALVGLGAVLGDLPAGRVVARFGERRSIIAGSLIGTAGVLLSLLAWTPAVLAVGALLTGVSNAVWGLARQSYLAEVVPVEMRARAMATFALMWRLGFLIGPFAGALMILGMGTRGGFAVQLAGVIVSGYLGLAGDDPAPAPAAAGDAGRRIAAHGRGPRIPGGGASAVGRPYRSGRRVGVAGVRYRRRVRPAVFVSGRAADGPLRPPVHRGAVAADHRAVLLPAAAGP
jgi:MFS family permease